MSEDKLYRLFKTDDDRIVVNGEGAILMLDQYDVGVYIYLHDDDKHKLGIPISSPPAQSPPVLSSPALSPPVVSPTVDSQEQSQLSTMKRQVAQWCHEGEEILISTYKKHKVLFTDISLKSEEVWEMIRSTLAGIGLIYTLTQVRDKWKNLKKSYHAYKGSMGPKNSGGAAKKEPAHFKLFDEILSKERQSKPAAIASSRRENQLPAVACDNNESEVDEPEAKKIKRTKLERKLSAWGETVQQQMEGNEAKREERFNIMHQTFSRMADAQEKGASSLEKITEYLMQKESK